MIGIRQSVSQSVGEDENENGMLSYYGNIGGEAKRWTNPAFLDRQERRWREKAAECSETMHLSTISVRSKMIRRWSTGAGFGGEGGPLNSASSRKIGAGGKQQ